MSLNLASGARVLDAGTGGGGGGALPPLVRAVGITGSVLAVDKDPTIVALASDYAEQAGITDQVTFQLGDLREVLIDAATTSENAFDAIWTADSIYPLYFEEPVDIVRQMVQALRPEGIIALFYPNYYHVTVLPGYSLLGRSVYSAAEIGAGTPVDGPRHRERYLTWLLAAGLDDVSLKVFSRVCFPIDTDPTVRPFFEQPLPPVREWVAVHGAAVGLSATEVPGHLATGRRPTGA